MSVWGSQEEKRKFAIGALFGSEFVGGIGGNTGNLNNMPNFKLFNNGLFLQVSFGTATQIDVSSITEVSE